MIIIVDTLIAALLQKSALLGAVRILRKVLEMGRKYRILIGFPWQPIVARHYCSILSCLMFIIIITITNIYKAKNSSKNYTKLNIFRVKPSSEKMNPS